jgi:CheY-like chemotaxis protein
MTATTLYSSKNMQSGRPLALVAEDNVTIRENTVRNLARHGVASIAVGSFTQAAGALSDVPRLDVALLDIHLALDKDRDDRGGIDIARLLRGKGSTARIIGYSAKFKDRTLTPSELKLFDSTETKGSLTHTDHVRLWKLCAEYAKESYSRRRSEELEHQEQLRRLYEIEVPAEEVLRRLQLDHQPIKQYMAEGALGLAGYRVKVVKLPPGESGEKSQPLLVWRQKVREGTKSWVNLEVYGYPALYATGANESAALKSLARSLRLTVADLAQMKKLGAADESLKLLLTYLFGGE